MVLKNLRTFLKGKAMTIDEFIQYIAPKMRPGWLAKYEIRKEWKVDKNEAEKFAEEILKLGARLMTPGVYRLGRFDFYPRKSNARDFRTNEFFTQEEALAKIKEIEG